MQRSGIDLHSWAVFCAGGTRPSPLDLAQDWQGTLGGGEAAHFPALRVSVSCFLLLVVLPVPVVPEQPDLGRCVSVCRGTGWTKAGSSPEEPKKYNGEQGDFSF